MFSWFTGTNRAKMEESFEVICEDNVTKDAKESSRPCMRKALLVGLNYKDTEDELSGCENDTRMMNKVLKEMEYSTTLMKDEDFEDKGIIQALNEMFEGAHAGDRFVFHYSGHGTSVDDVEMSESHEEGDEIDGKDEALCQGDDLVVDDDINKVLQSLPEGVTVVMIIDACCSGSIADLRHRLSFGCLSEIESTNEVNADVIMISGCEDEHTSSETYEEGTNYGALTYEVCQLLEGDNWPMYSWTLFCGLISARLRNKNFAQKPQLSASNLDLMMTKVAF